jgi:hypothetical protein
MFKVYTILAYSIGVPKEQGISAFWRGNTAGIWLFLTQSVLQIGLYDSFKGLQK